VVRNVSKIVPGDIYYVCARNIKKYCKAASMNVEQLAEKVGISPEYLRRIEAPKRKGGFTIQTAYDISCSISTPFTTLVIVNISLYYNMYKINLQI